MIRCVYWLLRVIWFAFLLPCIYNWLFLILSWMRLIYGRFFFDVTQKADVNDFILQFNSCFKNMIFFTTSSGILNFVLFFYYNIEKYVLIIGWLSILWFILSKVFEFWRLTTSNYKSISLIALIIVYTEIHS